MARRRRRKDTEQPPQITRKEYLRERKDRRDRQTLLAVVVPILVAVLLFIGYGIYKEVVQAPREPVARVNDESITTAEFQKRVNWERWSLLNNVASFASLAQSSDPSILQQFFEPQRTNIGDNTVSLLVDEALIRQEAAARGIDVSDGDVEDQIANDMATVVAPTPTFEAIDAETEGDLESDAAGDDAEDVGEGDQTGDDAADEVEGEADDAADEAEGDAVEDDAGDSAADEASSADGITASGAITDTEATTVTLSADEVEDAFEENVQRLLDQQGLTRTDYRHLLRQQLLRDKLSEALGAEVPITDKQVEAEYLVFESQETAQEAADALTGGAQWSAIVEQYLQDESAETDESLEGVEDDAAGDESAEADVDAESEGDEADAESEGDTADEALESIGDEDSITTTQLAELAEGLSVAGVLTDTDALTVTDELTVTEGLTTTEGLTATEELTATEGLTTTESLTDTAEAAPTPRPTAVPNPFAFEHGERRWFTVDGLKERLGLNDSDAGSVMDVEVTQVIGPITGSRGQYVIIVLDVDESRELEESEIETRREGALEPWLTTARSEARIDRFPLEGKIPLEPDWFLAGWERYVQPVPTIDAGALGIPDAPGDSGIDVSVGGEGDNESSGIDVSVGGDDGTGSDGGANAP